MEDKEIIEGLFARSEEALTRLSEKYGKLFVKLASNLLHNPLDAEECVNDSYLKVWNSIPPGRPEHLSAFVCKIVRVTAIDRLRYNTRSKRDEGAVVFLDELEGCLSGGTQPEEDFDAKETAVLLNRFLSSLKDDSRVIFVKRYYYFDSVENIALSLGISETNVTTNLYRSRKKLKTFLENEGVQV